MYNQKRYPGGKVTVDLIFGSLLAGLADRAARAPRRVGVERRAAREQRYALVLKRGFL